MYPHLALKADDVAIGGLPQIALHPPTDMRVRAGSDLRLAFVVGASLACVIVDYLKVNSRDLLQEFSGSYL